MVIALSTILLSAYQGGITVFSCIFCIFLIALTLVTAPTFCFHRAYGNCQFYNYCRNTYYLICHLCDFYLMSGKGHLICPRHQQLTPSLWSALDKIYA